jgi:hypothetical protein
MISTDAQSSVDAIRRAIAEAREEARRAAIDQAMGIFLKWTFDKKLTPSKAVDAIEELKGRDDDTG